MRKNEDRKHLSVYGRDLKRRRAGTDADEEEDAFVRSGTDNKKSGPLEKKK